MTKYLLLILCTVNLFAQNKQYTKGELTGKSDIQFFGEEYKLQKEAHEAFILMKNEAKKSNIELKIVSSYRSFEHQKRIWTRKYKKFTSEGLSPTEAISKIIEYSTIPGTSRHHWGTDIDIIDGNPKAPKSVLNPKNFIDNNVYNKLRVWLENNANKFDFFIVYTNSKDRKGFKYEPWHYSYKSISEKMLEQYLKIDVNKFLKSEKLIGSEYFRDDFIDKYIVENMCSINTVLK